MALSIFRENFVSKLRGSVRANLRRYEQPESWIDEFPGGSSSSLPTTVEPLQKLELRLPDGKDLKDTENAIHVHQALSFLTPLQARDPRLWTRLAHVECWQYMRERWNVERTQDNVEKAERFIISRYFIAQNQSRALLRHGIARLWWYGHVTHDAGRDNPYELTGVLLKTLDITQTLLERSLGRVPHVTSGFLDFLSRNDEKFLGAGNENRIRVRHLAKHLNLRGGITLLDCLSKSDIIAILDKEFRRVEAKPEVLLPVK